jgi:hypothetical protein
MAYFNNLSIRTFKLATLVSPESFLHDSNINGEKVIDFSSLAATVKYKKLHC